MEPEEFRKAVRKLLNPQGFRTGFARKQMEALAEDMDYGRLPVFDFEPGAFMAVEALPPTTQDRCEFAVTMDVAPQHVYDAAVLFGHMLRERTKVSDITHNGSDAGDGKVIFTAPAETRKRVMEAAQAVIRETGQGKSGPPGK